MFKFLMNEFWNVLKPALIIYGCVIAGAWALFTAYQLNIFQ